MGASKEEIDLKHDVYMSDISAWLLGRTKNKISTRGPAMLWIKPASIPGEVSSERIS
jgi:hypothetical protein